MELTLYYLLFLGIIYYASREVTTKIAGRREWELTPEFVLVLSFLVYTSAMPLSRLFWRSTPTDLDIEYMQVHILGALGMVAGLIVGKIIAGRWAAAPPVRPGRGTYLRPAKTVALIVTAVAVMFVFILYSVGFSMANILKPYGYEKNVVLEPSTRDTLTPPFAIALILTCYAGCLADPQKRKWPRRLVLAGALIVTALFLARGERNFSLFMWLPIGCLALGGRKLPLFKAFVVGVAAFALYSAVAVVRNFGLADADSSLVTLASMDPNKGELGTSFNVYSIFKDKGFSDSLEYGKTYTVDFLVNLIPVGLWPARPPSTGAKFSIRYYQTEDLVFGAGFSPVVEAEANFSWPGVLPVFTLFAIFVTVAAQYFRTRRRWGFVCNAMFLPMLVNWNRIDSNAGGKLFIVYAGFIIIFDRLLYPRATATAVMPWREMPAPLPASLGRRL